MCIKEIAKRLQLPDFLTGTIGREVYKRVSKALLINWLQKHTLDFIFWLE
jgi:Fe-S cluster biosynthesis and repair protein YggX